MAMTNCYDCGAPVSTSALICPKCGKQYPAVNPARKFVLLGVAAILILLSALFFRH